ncbi:host attachment family protein [Novosphingobium album (ex Liu et al. 2023)]|uniref:Host attachment family protein n=1 Tax=Novosphingobium album (ex Liu et al. 2023) TaxID=3031130 RepID=A0ABT5WJH0_9SPHN|nr:host attachment family protein [Novosphingobium album (ex Liu et al. 2023)]MDE8650192.1 host attachment family protein [Novosphingobium album (ex Liu et al. 2023)]
MKLVHDMIVLVVDGSRMLLLRNQGDEVYPDLRVIEHRQFENLPNRDLLSDAPGVDFSAGYPGRSTFEESDPHQANEDLFIAAAADTLASVAANGQDRLIVAAPPRALGELRRHYTQDVRARLVAEIDKDFTRHTVDEIARLLSVHGEPAGA